MIADVSFEAAEPYDFVQRHPDPVIDDLSDDIEGESEKSVLSFSQ